jgi:hypothetical protein
MNSLSITTGLRYISAMTMPVSTKETRSSRLLLGVVSAPCVSPRRRRWYDDNNYIIIIIIIIIRRRSAREIECPTDWMIFQVVFTASITTKNGILHIPTSRNRTGSDLANFEATVQCLLLLLEHSLNSPQNGLLRVLLHFFLRRNQMGDRKMVSACA